MSDVKYFSWSSYQCFLVQLVPFAKAQTTLALSVATAVAGQSWYVRLVPLNFRLLTGREALQHCIANLFFHWLERRGPDLVCLELCGMPMNLKTLD